MVWKFYHQHLSWWLLYLQVFPVCSLLGIGVLLTNIPGSAIKDYENDIKYLGEVKKADAADYRQEILRLKGTINKMKQGNTVTETDMKNASGLGDVIMQLIPNKYRKAASFLVPQVEEAVKKDPAIVERIYEKIKSANTSNKQAQPGTQDQGTNTL